MIRVLVIDDSKFMANGIKSVLEALDFEVTGMAHDGLEGVAAFEEHRPDVTLLDITMPNMDGIQCLDRIRELDEDARVVMLSAIRNAETEQLCLEKGAKGFINKPIKRGSPSDLARLCEALENAVASLE